METVATFTGEGFTSHILKETLPVERWVYESDLDVDADGANGQNEKPAAYMKGNKGTEDLANAGYPKSPKAYRNILICSGDTPIVYPGGVIASRTSYRYPNKPDRPDAYLDSETIRYIAIPPLIREKAKGFVLGCLCKVVNLRNQKSVYAMVGDIGPAKKNGEGSIQLCRELGVDPRPRNGGTNQKIIRFEIYPNQFYNQDGYDFPLMPAKGGYIYKPSR